MPRTHCPRRGVSKRTELGALLADARTGQTLSDGRRGLHSRSTLGGRLHEHRQFQFALRRADAALLVTGHAAVPERAVFGNAVGDLPPAP
jgi:hypothetical protein